MLINKKELEKYLNHKFLQLKEVVTDFINWLDSEPYRDHYQYGDIRIHKQAHIKYRDKTKLEETLVSLARDGVIFNG